MNKSETKLNTIRQVKELVESRIEKIGPVMDDYDVGQRVAYSNIMSDLAAFEAIIEHTSENLTDTQRRG